MGRTHDICVMRENQRGPGTRGGRHPPAQEVGNGGPESSQPGHEPLPPGESSRTPFSSLCQTHPASPVTSSTHSLLSSREATGKGKLEMQLLLHGQREAEAQTLQKHLVLLNGDTARAQAMGERRKMGEGNLPSRQPAAGQPRAGCTKYP